MAACRLASKGRTMADSSYASEVQAILAFLSLQRAGGSNGGSGNKPQGPEAPAEGLNPYGLVAPRFQRKFKAKQVPEGVGMGTTTFSYPPLTPGPPTAHSSLGNPYSHSFLILPCPRLLSRRVPGPL